MARETKVGLLVGLAFIICFTVILANRGRSSIPVETVVQHTAADVPSTLGRGAVRPPMGRSGPRVASPAAANVSTNSNRPVETSSNGRAANVPGSGADVVFGQDRTSTVTIPWNPPTQGRGSESPAPPVAVREAVEPPPSSEGTPLHAQPSTPDARFVIREAVESPFPNGGKGAFGRTHLVEPGENLSKIAFRYFGTRSRATVAAIFEANRDQLTSPDAVRSGMTLRLPEAPGAGSVLPAADVTMAGEASVKGKTEKGTDERKAKDKDGGKGSASKVASGSSEWRWYQVKKNDRLSSIAREQLGDGSRWRELYELNKDKFPDPEKIREGVRIRLPASSVLAAMESKR